MTIKVIAGALRNTINNNGPITIQRIGSAANTIYSQCIQIDHEKMQ